MVCLRCGWCCRNIWPGNNNEELDVPIPCPNLLEIKGNVAICRIYKSRPVQCQKEHMGAGEGEPCMIGLQAVDAGTIPRPTNKCMCCGDPCYDTTFCSDLCEKRMIEGL